ncbi:zinc finger protein OZF-like [Maniola jurtina]|uniref:zinc finger protein OZF-like n=1 Tax=Maniola jurtina TaxID=191418 RepID=UPI001E68F63D|nr:zinc finger protein OZF-like [Maniola jurtina]
MAKKTKTTVVNLPKIRYITIVRGLSKSITNSVKISEKGSRRHKTIEIYIGESSKNPKRERPRRIEPEIIFNKKGGELQKHRFNLRQILLNTNATPIRCRGGIGYACCFCTEQFPDAADLKKHTIEFHDEKTSLNFMKGKDMYKFHVKLDITALKCNICNTDVETLEQVIDHLKDVHNKEMFTDIKHQMLPFKFDTERLQCCICHNTYHKFKSLLEHMNVHYRNHVCEVCDAGFVSRVILAQHAESHKLGTFNCDYCAKTFDTFRKKRSHEKCIHTHSATLNKCGYCNEKFKDYRKKERHLTEVHGITSLTLNCQACDKTFNNQKEYSIHLRRLHLMDKRFKCTECDMSFFSSAELNCHTVKHTGVRKFECEVCHKAYGRMKTLREHMRIHMDDRRFKCEHCGQAFVQKCSWRGHMRSKHGEQV